MSGENQLLVFFIMLLIGLVVSGLLFRNDSLEGTIFNVLIGYFALTLLIFLIP